jgi:hypothetical protein
LNCEKKLPKDKFIPHVQNYTYKITYFYFAGYKITDKITHRKFISQLEAKALISVYAHENHHAEFAEPWPF